MHLARFLAFVTWIGIATSSASAADSRSITVLWYTYSHPESWYRGMIEKLGGVVHTLPQSGGIKWKISFFGTDSPTPQFSRYDVLVIQSGEGFGSGPPSAGTPTKVDFSGILKHKAAIERARGTRTVLTGADADVHAIGGETGNAPRMVGHRVTCKPIFTARRCWDGAVGHLVNAVNWAAEGLGLGIVGLVAAEFPGSNWWLHPESFLRLELSANGSRNDLVMFLGPGTRENYPVIPPSAQSHRLNRGLTSKGLSNWANSFHAAFSHSLPGYTHIVNSTRHSGMAVTIASDKLLSNETDGVSS